MNTPPDPLDGALDRALAKTLTAPGLPAGFRAQLRAAIARHPQQDRAQLRAALEREHAAQLAELRSGYVRLRQRTLGILIGSGFAAGLLVTLALPWLKAHFGQDGVFALPAIGAIIGLALSLNAWWQRSNLARALERHLS
ncbi:MAG: hypothetical protein KGL25_01160 [Gammaproteobacteria bacterium]|nr:hypothetical protein [Gammaproteobacteria bacterium]MDE2250000.1 hypothetical protein [Gammaproteobacteria bacterium]